MSADAGEGGRARHALPNPPRLLAATSFWQFALIASLLPLLPVYLDTLGVSASGIAFLFGVQSLTALVCNQVFGYLADTVMRRTTMMLWMSLLAALVQALFPLIPPSMTMLSLGMVGISIFLAPRITLFNAVVLDSRRGEELFGRIRVVGSLGFALVTLLMGWLADQPWLTVAIMWPVLVVFELLFATSLTKIKDDLPAMRAQEHRISFWQAQRVLLTEPSMRWFLVFTLIYNSVAAPAHVLQSTLLTELGATALFVTGAMAFGAVAEMAIFVYGHEVLRRVRLMPLLAFVPIALVLRCGLVYLFPHPWVIFAVNVFHLFNFGLAYMCSVIFIHREVPAELRSSGQTLFGIAFSSVAVLLGNGLYAGFVGWLSSDAGLGLGDAEAMRIWYGAAAVFVLLAFLPWLPMKRAYERKHRVSGFWIR